VYITHYSALKTISSDHARATFIDRTVRLFYGPTGTGKTHRAFDELGLSAFVKDPRTKWWDNYRGEEGVIIDEFRGDISISWILKWTDKYPVWVEPKRGCVPLRASQLIFTSNLPIEQWYPDLDPDSLAALKRRFTSIEYMDRPHVSTRPSPAVIENHENLFTE